MSVYFTTCQIIRLVTKRKEKKYRNRERAREREVVNEGRKGRNDKKKKRKCGRKIKGKV